MTRLEQTMLTLLADGKEHSLQEFGERLQSDRATVDAGLQRLRDLGLDIQTLTQDHYILSTPLELLEHKRITADLSDIARIWLNQLEIHTILDSTNNYLLSRAREGYPSGVVCFSEWQQAGRGRQGRSWVSPLGAGVFCSLLWRFHVPAAALSGLSLAVGIAVARAVQSLGVADVELKWPNDLWWHQRKLGGILLESGDDNGVFYVVAGIGVNVALPHQAATAIDQPWVDLQEILGVGCVSRNRLAAALINQLIEVLIPFEQGGFADLAAEWARFDSVIGQRVCLHLPNATVSGIARGVDASGALLLESGDAQMKSLKPYVGGEISLRLET